MNALGTHARHLQPLARLASDSRLPLAQLKQRSSQAQPRCVERILEDGVCQATHSYGVHSRRLARDIFTTFYMDSSQYYVTNR